MSINFNISISKYFIETTSNSAYLSDYLTVAAKCEDVHSLLEEKRQQFMIRNSTSFSISPSLSGPSDFSDIFESSLAPFRFSHFAASDFLITDIPDTIEDLPVNTSPLEERALELGKQINLIYETRLLPDFLKVEDRENLCDVDCESYKEIHLEFYHFVNSQKVQMSNDQPRIEEFLRAFKNCEFETLQDPKMPYYALAAFAQKEIDVDDMATLMELFVTRLCFPECQIHFFFQGDEVNPLARDLADSLNDSSLGLARTSPYLWKDRFFEKMKELPKHKQFFWQYPSFLDCQEVTAAIGQGMDPQPYFSMPGGTTLALSTVHARKTLEGQEYSFSYNAEHLFLQTRYHKKQDPLFPQLGAFSPSDIKKALLEQNQRPCITYYPDIKPAIQTHGCLELPTLIIAHDKAHAHILQSYPEELVRAIKETIQEFESLTGFAMSKEIWEMTDMLAPKIVQGFEKAEFSRFLRSLSVKKEDLSIEDLIFDSSSNYNPTPLGWLTMLKSYETGCSSWNREEPFMRMIEEAYSMGIMKEKDSTKQKIWKLQQYVTNCYNSFVEHESNFEGFSLEKSEEELEFVKIKEGKRKNCIILQAKS